MTNPMNALILVVLLTGAAFSTSASAQSNPASPSSAPQTSSVQSESQTTPDLIGVTITGEVRKAGEYRVRRESTVRQAIEVAGGASEFGALNRTQIIREQDGKRLTIDVTMNDPLLPGDVIIVPRRRL